MRGAKGGGIRVVSTPQFWSRAEAARVVRRGLGLRALRGPQRLPDAGTAEVEAGAGVFVCEGRPRGLRLTSGRGERRAVSEWVNERP